MHHLPERAQIVAKIETNLSRRILIQCLVLTSPTILIQLS